MLLSKKERAKLRTSPQAKPQALSFRVWSCVQREKYASSRMLLILPLMVCHLRGRRTQIPRFHVLVPCSLRTMRLAPCYGNMSCAECFLPPNIHVFLNYTPSTLHS